MSMGAFSSAFGVTRLVPFLNDDEDIVAAPNDVELFQPQPPVADAFAGLQLVFIAVPWADEMDLVRERLALIGAVRRDHIDHAVDHEPLAGRPAGMHAGVAVGEVGAILVEHADFRVSSNDDAPIAVLHLGRLGNEAFRHGDTPRAHSSMAPPRGVAQNAWHEAGASGRDSDTPKRRMMLAVATQRWEPLDASRATQIALQTRCGVAGMSM